MDALFAADTVAQPLRRLGFWHSLQTDGLFGMLRCIPPTERRANSMQMQALADRLPEWLNRAVMSVSD